MKKENKTEDTRTEDTKAEEVKANDTSKAAAPKMRRIIIETNGSDVQLVQADVAGRIELIGVLQNMLAYLNQTK